MGFLRIRNREGYDVYFRPYAGDHNAGYILLDLDHPAPDILARVRAQGHALCVVVETSPGRWQAWIRVSPAPLVPPLATRIPKRLAEIYGADRASADWRHLGRLAGFTNRKPQHQVDGLAPWVKLIYARSGLALNGAALLASAAEVPTGRPRRGRPLPPSPAALPPPINSPALRDLYQTCLNRLGIRERYPSPDWSIADKWDARELLETGAAPALVTAVLRHGSPGFPRRHADPEDYLHRTLRSAASFSRAPYHVCSTDSPAARALCASAALHGAWDTGFASACEYPIPAAGPQRSRPMPKNRRFLMPANTVLHCSPLR